MPRKAPSYLLLNGFNIYHLRLPVPKRLQSVIKQREIKRSLRTGNRREALRKSRILAGKYQEAFDQMGKYDEEVEKLLNNPLSAHMKMSLERKPDGTITINGLELDPDKPEIEKELFESAIDKLSLLKIDPAPPPPPIQPQDSKPSVSLKKLIDEYLEAVSKDIDDEKTLRGYKSHLVTFLDIIGDIPVNEITSKRAREAVATLKQLPPNRNKLSAYRSLSIAAIIELKPPKTLSNTTVKLHINRAKALFGFGKDEQLCTLNPFERIKIKNKLRPDQERKIFEPEDLKALWAVHLLTLTRGECCYVYFSRIYQVKLRFFSLLLNQGLPITILFTQIYCHTVYNYELY